MPAVLIFRNELLPLSETFVREPALALNRYESYFVGMRAVQGLELPVSRMVLANSGGRIGRMKEILYRLTTKAPSSFVRKLREFRPMLVHAHFGFDACWAVSVARRLGVPLVVTLHGYDVTMRVEEFNRQRNPLLRYYPGRRASLFRTADQFIAVSNFILETAVAAGCPRDKLTTLHAGIDLGQFTPATSPVVAKRVVFIGRLIENKGCDHLLRAMAMVQAQHADAELVVIGDGPMRSSLEDFARHHLKACTFTGAQNKSQIVEHLRRAWVLSVPSIAVASGASEGFGVVFLEAQACAVPVVSYQTGGIAEAVEHGVSGVLVTPGDITALAQAIGSVLESPSERARMAMAGRRRIEQSFSLARHVAGLEAIYDTAVECHRLAQSNRT